MDSNLILASGPPMSWKEYRGGQKNAILGGAVHEGLADTKEKAEEEIEKGNIQVSSCQEYNCVGSLAGIYTASMPVLVVEDTVSGNRSFCTLFEEIGRASCRKECRCRGWWSGQYERK